MAYTRKSVYWNPGRLEIEGTFTTDNTGAVQTITNKDGSTKTTTGQYMAVAKTGAGQYDITCKAASNLDGQPVFQQVELLDLFASLIGAAVAGATQARGVSVTKDANGNLVLRVLLTNNAGVATDTTAAITVAFGAVIAYERFDGVI